jgi:periplasmic copper chaperone A
MTRFSFTRAAALVMFSLIAPLAFAHEYKVGDLEIHHPWTRATPPGAEVAGGFFEVVNHGSTADRLTSVKIDGIPIVQIHEMATTNGVMSMRPLDGGLEIPAGATVTLKPGSFHVMMMGLKAPFAEGKMVAGTLHFEKAGDVAVEFKVEAMGADMSKGHDHSSSTMQMN